MAVRLPNSTDPRELDATIASARDAVASPSDAAALAEHLAASGSQLKVVDRAADIASTGGPGSASTLLAPFVLVQLGGVVVKIGVPGRPAGAIDTLGTLPSYRTRLTADEARQAARSSGIAHMLADAEFAPLDAALFRRRKEVGALAVPVLVAASLLAKKLAAGVQRVGLDLRVSPFGNFGRNVEAARRNARLFCASAKILSIDATVFLSTDRVPAMPFVGRGESLQALAIACGERKAPPEIAGWLASHFEDCAQMALRTMDVAQKSASRSLSDVVARHLEAQGSSLDALIARADEAASTPTAMISADRDGVFVPDIQAVRALITAEQSRADTDGRFSDPCGVTLLARPGTKVGRGDTIARVRHLQRSSAFEEGVRLALTIDESVEPDDSGRDNLESVSA